MRFDIHITADNGMETVANYTNLTVDESLEIIKFTFKQTNRQLRIKITEVTPNAEN